jgi:NADPH-dependent 2,4-dienoyl-CoA reductase/sulfur reductase-like enzyme
MGLVGSGILKAVVVGAGAIGVELSLALSSQGIEVHLVDMQGSVLPGLLDSDMSASIGEEITRAGVRLHLGAKITELEGSSFVQQVHLDNGGTIDLGAPEGRDGTGKGGLTGIVVFAVGMVPETSLFENSGLAVGKDGIIVNEKMETNFPGVYSAGDCTQYTSGITGEVVSGKLATNAVPMAKVIGHNLLGRERTYPGFFNGAATKAGKIFAGGTGLTEKNAARSGYDTVCGFGESTTRFPIMPGAKPVRLKLIADAKSHRLLGAQVVSEEAVSGRVDLLTFAIQKNTTIEELADLSYSAQPYQSFFPAANIIVTAAEDILRNT